MINSGIEYIEVRQMSWWGHFRRAEQSRTVKIVWEVKIPKRLKRKRLRKTWNKALQIQGEKKNLSRSKDVSKKQKGMNKVYLQLMYFNCGN